MYARLWLSNHDIITLAFVKCEILTGYKHALETTTDNLEQTVNFPVQRERTLDLVLTNLHDHYETPTQRPPFGLFGPYVYRSSIEGED